MKYFPTPEVFVLPAFFLFLWLEYQMARRHGKQIYRYESSITNISIGVAERLLDLFIAGLAYNMFSYVYQHYSVFKIPNNWWIWILLLLATDFVWYWYHRLGHKINFLWAAHIVHHQSEEFNLTVSARITLFQSLIRNLFWCVLPFLGFRPLMVTTILMVHGAYSFFTHTQLVPRIKWLEYALITPSLHGVHHASDELYLDKNFGDVFVFWDKLFGTFQAEQHKPVYGLTHPIKSQSFLWQHFHYYLELFVAIRSEKSFVGKLKIFFGNPATLNQAIRPQLEEYLFGPRKKCQPNSTLKAYVIVQIVACLIMLFAFTLIFKSVDVYIKCGVVSIIMISLINCGALLEQKKYIYYLEWFRLTAIFCLLAYIYKDTVWLFPLPVLLLLSHWLGFEKKFPRYILQRESVES